MKIRELRLSDFARFEARQFSFQAGFNLLCGGNSTGKSSLVSALRAVLAGRLAEGYRQPDGASPPAVAVRVDTPAGEQLVERVFDGNLERGGASLPWGSETLAEAMVWEEGGLLSRSADDLRRILRQLALVEDEVDAQVLPRLQEEYRGLTSRDPWGEGRDAPGELERVRERLAEIELLWEDRLEALKQLGALRDELPDGAVLSRPEAVATPDVAAPPEESPEDLPDPPEGNPPAHSPSEGAMFAWDEGDDVLPERDPATVRERLWSVQKEAAALRHELVAVPSLSPLFPSVLTALFALLALALMAFHRDLWQAAALAFGGLTLCTWSVFAYLARHKGGELAALRERLGRAEREREGLLQELDRLDEQRRYGSHDDDDAVPEDHQAEASEAPLSGHEDATGDPGGDDPSAGSEEDQPPRIPLRQQRRQLLAQVSDLRALEMEGEVLRFREEQIVMRLKVLTTAIEMLLQAEDQFSEARRRELGEALNRYLGQLVAEPPVTVSLGSNWQLELFSPLEQRHLGVRELSRGERTLVSLALHLALIDLCGGENRLPLVADDLLDDLQREWREGVVKGLERFARTHQLVLASRDPELQTRAMTAGWHVVSLDSNAPRQSAKKAPKGGAERTDDEQQLHLL